MGAVNTRLLRMQIAQRGGEKIASRANAAIREKFNDKKDILLKEFDEHPITQELEGGPEYAGPSVVQTEHGGNLYGFLGFDEGERPTEVVREILEKQIKLDTSKKRTITVESSGRILVEIPVSIPTLQEIYLQTSENN